LLPQTTCADCVESLGDLLPPSPPAEQASARQDQAGQTSTGDGARNRSCAYEAEVIGGQECLSSRGKMLIVGKKARLLCVG
jgi:hypothetical protein